MHLAVCHESWLNIWNMGTAANANRWDGESDQWKGVGVCQWDKEHIENYLAFET